MKICVTRRQTPDAKPKIYVSPNAKPRRQSVEYRLRWVPGVGSLHWACTFHIFCVDFICVGLPTQTQFSVEYGLNCNISEALMKLHKHNKEIYLEGTMSQFFSYKYWFRYCDYRNIILLNKLKKSLCQDVVKRV